MLALKANRPATYHDVVRFFDPPPADMIEPGHETLDNDNDHGRLEQRRHLVCHDVGWLQSDRRYPDEPHFPHLAMIAMVESRTERGGRIERQRRYYLSSAKLDARDPGRRRPCPLGHRKPSALGARRCLPRRPGPSENRIRTANMAVVKHKAMNLVRNSNDKHSLKVRRRKANLNIDYLENLIRQNPALT